MSFWRNKARKQEFKSGGVVPDARLARSFATGGVIADTVVPEVLTAYTQRLVSKKTVLAQMGIEPNFDGVGDTMGFDSGPDGYNDQGGPLMECVWCGSYGTHKPDCKALSRNYPKSSLGTQREMTERLRSEMDRVQRAAYYQGSGGTGPVGFVGPAATARPEPPKDERTELQKRFDAIAEELDESK